MGLDFFRIADRLRAAPFNITIIKGFCTNIWTARQQLQKTINQIPKKDILVVKRVGMLKLGRMCMQTRETFVGPTAMLPLRNELNLIGHLKSCLYIHPLQHLILDYKTECPCSKDS